jgi:N-acetylmuramoyl-L-alanine amidase
VRSVTATREATDRVRYVVQLTASPFGWHAFWSGSAFVLRIRRPPAVDPVRPLAGRRIVVDPGHPPLGSRGPTGLYEAVAVREVAERLARRLREAGATVVLTRTDDAPLALGQRPVLARRANGEAFVSIHLNALPDGANPFNPRLGSGTYWFHAPSAGLAQAVQAGLVSRMGLADEGTFFDNLAVVRQTWMPSVLTEGAYVMLPEHEAALRTSTFQEAYAAGIADGLAAFFRGLAR